MASTCSGVILPVAGMASMVPETSARNCRTKAVELFTAHMWEMQRAKIRYYFASRNCSYVLLLMLERHFRVP